MTDAPSRLAAALADRYRIERPLGEGGMATVYLAQDLKHDRRVAIKLLKPELAAVIGSERFLAEIKTTANLQHPHILPLFDSGDADGLLWYAMPYVAGESLRERLDRERELPVDEAVNIARSIAEALDHAHRNGVIHRDIKPENILLHDGNPLVADFGISVAVSAAGAQRVTATGLSLGTPHYMSPEQASADRELTGRSDIYSLGAVLQEMLTGRTPHEGATARAVVLRIIADDPQPIDELRRTVPNNVVAAVANALEKLPADRFGSAAEFARALADPNFRHGSGAGRLPGSAGGWLADPRSKIAVGIAVTGLALAVFSRAAGPSPTGGPGVLDVGPPPTMFAVDLGELAVPSDLSLSPDGDRLVFASSEPGDVPRLYLREAGSVEITPIPGTEYGSQPAFSPDGEWIAFVVGETVLMRVPAAGGPPLEVTEMDPILAAPSWTAGGSILFAGIDGLFEVDAGGGPVTTLHEGALFMARSPRAVGDSRWILYTHQATTSTQPEIRLLERESAEVSTIADGRDARYLPSGHLIFVTLDGTTVSAPFDAHAGVISGPVTAMTQDIATGPLEGEGMHFTLAGNGTAAYGVGGNTIQEELVTLDLSGGEADIPGLRSGNFSAPRFDPSGRFLAFELDGDLFIRDLVVGTQTVLATGASFNPVWSRDGSRVAYGRSLPTGGEVLVRDASLEEAPQVLVTSNRFAVPSAWTPSGDTVLYSDFDGQEAYASEIWTIGSDGQSSRAPFLRATGWGEAFASLSPDGRWAAYESTEDGGTAIYVQSFPTPGQRIRISDGDGLGARWSLTGDKIFYRAADTVKVAHVRMESTVTVVRNEALFTGPYSGIDPHPDGDRLVAIKRIRTTDPGASEGRLLFVVNWLGQFAEQLSGS